MNIDIENNEEIYNHLIHNQNYVRDELKKLSNIGGAQPDILAILGDLVRGFYKGMSLVS